VAFENVTVNGNKLIVMIGVDSAHDILSILNIDLSEASADITDACEWLCGVEGKWWAIEGHQLNLTDEYACRYTTCDEAGVDDVVVIERIDDGQDAIDLGEWLRGIARGFGPSNGMVR